MKYGAGEGLRRIAGQIVWDVLHRVKAKNVYIACNADWIGHVLRRNCVLRHVNEWKIEGQITVTGRLGKRRKQLLDDLNITTEYWKLKEEALDRTVWRTEFGRGCGPVVRQTAEWMIELATIVNLECVYLIFAGININLLKATGHVMHQPV